MTIIDIQNPLYDPLKIFNDFKKDLGLNIKNDTVYFRNSTVQSFVEQQIYYHKNFDKPKLTVHICIIAVELLEIWEQLGFIITRRLKNTSIYSIYSGSSEICI